MSWEDLDQAERTGNHSAAGASREWPEEFWRAFEGMPEDFERPRQHSQKRESMESAGAEYCV